jgi:beta-xylosidase
VAVVATAAALLLVPGPAAHADNPVITDRFVADPSAHVFDGRLYIYATDDETNSGSYWDSRDWRVYSSDDVTQWTDHGQVFAIDGGFDWASEYAWAPAAAERDGWYYLYLPVDRTSIGVARSTSPTSGFTDPIGGPLIEKGRDENTGEEPIDPMVFTDDDGQSYMYFGTRTPKVVKLGSDMISTEGPILDVEISEDNYGEAPWLHKHQGVYYLSYSTGWPGQITYATSDSPLGPFTYRGVALDYVNTSTNHASIVEYEGQWYMAYHSNALPGGGDYRRSIPIDRIHHNSDGTIRQVEPTSAGAGHQP